LSKVGFFHFGANHEAPLASLCAAVREHTNARLAGALIVLPEAFNYPTDYWDRDKPAHPDPRLKHELHVIARELRVVFVAGLIDPDEKSSAYLIDGQRPPKLICHKASDDKLGHYTPYREGDAMSGNPLPSDESFDQICVAALICNDATYDLDPLVLKLRQTVTVKLDGCNLKHKILCIPACDRTSARSQFPRDSKNRILVLANSYPSECGSFIMINGAEKESANGKENKVCLVEL